MDIYRHIYRLSGIMANDGAGSEALAAAQVEAAALAAQNTADDGFADTFEGFDGAAASMMPVAPTAANDAGQSSSGIDEGGDSKLFRAIWALRGRGVRRMPVVIGAAVGPHACVSPPLSSTPRLPACTPHHERHAGNN